MYKLIKNNINAKNYELNEMTQRINRFAAAGKITPDEQDELLMLAQTNADVKNEIDLIKTVLELDRRVRALEEGQQTATPPEDAPEFVVGKWYRAGDRVKFEGKVYKCIAPKDVVCVWDPEKYPAYWEMEA